MLRILKTPIQQYDMPYLAQNEPRRGHQNASPGTIVIAALVPASRSSEMRVLRAKRGELGCKARVSSSLVKMPWPVESHAARSTIQGGCWSQTEHGGTGREERPTTHAARPISAQNVLFPGRQYNKTQSRRNKTARMIEPCMDRGLLKALQDGRGTCSMTPLIHTTRHLALPCKRDSRGLLW